jgi:YD repeat-containing protein
MPFSTSVPLSRLISLLTCNISARLIKLVCLVSFFAIGYSILQIHLKQDSATAKGSPPRWTQAPPSRNLPNIEETREVMPGTPKIMAPAPAIKRRGRDEKYKKAEWKISENLHGKQDRLPAYSGYPSRQDYADLMKTKIPALSILADLIYGPARMISNFPDIPYSDDEGALTEFAVTPTNPRNDGAAPDANMSSQTSCIENVPANRWKGEYRVLQECCLALVHDEGDGFLTFDPNVPFLGTPCGLSPISFWVDWTRTVNFTPNTYRFIINSSNVAKLYIDGQLKLSKSELDATAVADVALTAGNHELKLKDVSSYAIYSGFSLTWAAGCQENVPADRWKGEYFNNTSLSGVPTIVRNDGADFLNRNFGDGSPGSGCGLGADNFSARWTRTANFEAGTYRFTTTVDNGVRLYVDGQLKIDLWADLPPNTYTADVPLSAGDHVIRLEFVEYSGAASATLSWAPVCQENVPADRWKGEYFNNQTLSGSPTVIRDDGNGFLNLNFGGGSPSPACGLGADNFSARWTRTVNFAAGTYRFITAVDNGVRLYVDGQLKIDQWADLPPNTYTADVPLSAGDHVIRLEFVEYLGAANASLSWASVAAGDLNMALIDPINRIGSSGEDLLSLNYNWSLPLLSLRGRSGLDLGLTLSLNSLVYAKAGLVMYFDPDRGDPAPGFKLGFPEIRNAFTNTDAGAQSYLLSLPSGRRVEFRQINTNVYEAVDSSYMLLTRDVVSSVFILYTTDGTQCRFVDVTGSGDYKCVQIKDRHGNYITIGYGGLAEIRTITDTLGRVIAFNYDGSNHLKSITQNRGGQTYTWATFAYGTQTIQTNFPGLSLSGTTNGAQKSVLQRVGLADGSVYSFEYNTYCQVKTIRRYAPDNSNPVDFPDDYLQLAYTTYGLPDNADDPQTDCPRITSRTDWAYNWNPGVKSTYDADPGHAWGQVTFPDGTIYKELFAATGWQRGLTTQTENWSGGVKKKWTTLEWTQDNTGVSYLLNPRVIETNVYDEAGNRRRRTSSYTSFGLPSDVYDYDANATTVLRRAHTDYNLSAVYIGRRIIGLPSARYLYDGNNTLFSKVTYEYDLTPDPYLQHQGPPVRHDTANYGIDFVQGRGNLNVVRRWDVNDPDDDSKASEYETGYNTSGSVIFKRDPLDHQTDVSYADSFSDGQNNRNTYAYPTEVTDPDNFSSTVQYNYDSGAVMRTQDPNGAAVTRAYDAAGRIERTTTVATGGYTRYVYGQNQLYIDSYTTVKALNSEFHQITVFDGHGRTLGVASEHPGSVGGYKAQVFEYDIMGRPVRQTNPTEITSPTTSVVAWTPAGDDAASGWRRRSQSYDWQGRQTVSTNQDGTTRLFEYSSCGCAGGNWVVEKEEELVMPFVEELRRRKLKTTYDALGRVSKVEQFRFVSFEPEDAVYRTTTYTYNARNQATSVKVYEGVPTSDGSCPSGTCQETTMAYDGHGRLSARHKPVDEQNTNSFYEYYENDLLRQVTDPRGVVTNYTYYGRPLVKDITYGAAAGVNASSPVHYEYDSMGNRTLMTDALGEARYYYYNNSSRMQYETRQFNDIDVTSRIDYQYNVSGQLSNISINSAGVSLSYSYDKAGQMTGVAGSGYSGVSTFLSQATYRAWGDIKALAYGNGRVMNYEYNSRLQTSHMDMPGVISSDYAYYDDGRLFEISSVAPSGGDTQISLNRQYYYDEMGRFSMLSRAPYSLLDGGPGYSISHAYNAFDNMKSQDHTYGPLISNTISSYSTTWLNNRNQDPKIGQGGYDKAGNLKRHDNRMYTYNSAGKPVSVSDLNLSYAYDGDGYKVKEVRTAPPQQGVPVNLLNYTTYFVRSTVLEGKVVMELNGSGQRKWDYIYGVGGGLLAEHNPTGQEMPGHRFGPRDIPAQPQGDFVPFIPAQPNKVLWYHMAPHDAMAWATRTGGALIRQNVENSYTTYEIQEKDLEGNIVDFRRAEFGFALGQSVQLLSSLTFISPYLGNPFDPGAGCSIDGVQNACGIAMLFANSEAAKSIQVTDLLITGPPHLNPFGSDVIFPTYINGEVEYPKYDPETGDLIGYGYLPIYRAGIRALSPPQGTPPPHVPNITPERVDEHGNIIPERRVQNPDACGALADEAGRLANNALRQEGDTNIDVQRLARVQFDTQLSGIYAGQRLATLVNAWSLSKGANIQQANARGLLGETGFKSEFTGERTGFNDQTHHFVTYFSAGLNGFTSAAFIHKYFFEDNEPDRLLGDAAFDLGMAIRDKPATLKNVRADIIKKICDDRPR